MSTSCSHPITAHHHPQRHADPEERDGDDDEGPGAADEGLVGEGGEDGHLLVSVSSLQLRLAGLQLLYRPRVSRPVTRAL